MKKDLSLTFNNGEELVIKNDNIVLLDKHKKAIQNISKDEVCNKICCSYKFGNKSGEGLFWLNGETYESEDVDISIFLPFINKLQQLIRDSYKKIYLKY